MVIEQRTEGIKAGLKRTLIWTLCLCILGTFVSAQELETDDQGEQNYYIEKTPEGIRFMQRLSWFPVEFAYRYEIIIEKQEDEGGYAEVLREITQDPFITCSLHPGNYRYQVRVHDLLGRTGDPRSWEYFEVFPALQPELFQFSPEVFYLDRDTTFTLTITGRNLIKGSKIYLQSQNDPERRITPRHYSPSESNESALLSFDIQTLIPDRYAIFVQNPGGLEAALGDFKIGNKNSFDMMITAVYAPQFPLYGSFFKEFFDTTAIPIGFAVQFAIIPFRYVFGSIGFEVLPSWTYWSFLEDRYSAYAQFVDFQMRVFFQKWFFHRTLALNFHLGGGVTLIYDMHFEYGSFKTESLFTWVPSASVKFSTQWLILNPFFIELGIEFTQLFSADNATPGYIRPTLGIGWAW